MASIDIDLARLRGEFDRHSADRLESMRALLVALEQRPGAREALEQLRRDFHAFAGLGTTFGRPLATELADPAEARISILLQKDSQVTQDDIAEWRRLVGELTAYFESAVQ